MPNVGPPSDPYDLANVAGSAILQRFEITQLEIAFVLDPDGQQPPMILVSQ